MIPGPGIWDASQDMNGLQTRGETILRTVLASAAIIYLLLYLAVAVLRINYPYELEWQEGGQVDQVLRILQSEKLYVEPSRDFVPFAYNPLYYYVAAAVSLMTGPGFFALRLVSFSSSLASLGILFLFARRETGSSFLALLAVGLFAATYPLSDAWWDIGRVDSLFLFFLLSALYVLRFHFTTRGVIGAGVLFFLSFLTKQTAMIPAVAMALYCWTKDRRLGLFFSAASIGASGLAYLLLDALHNGWYSYYVLLLGRVPLEKTWFLQFWTQDLLIHLPVVLLLCVYTLLQRQVASRRFHLFAATAILIVSWSGRVHSGGWMNALMPLHAELALLFCLGLQAAGKRHAIVALTMIQFAILAYRPAEHLPTREDRLAGDAFIERLRNTTGDVLIPYHGFYSTLAGKKIHANIATIHIIVGTGDAELSGKLFRQIRESIQEQAYGAIVLDREWFRKDLDSYYQDDGPVFREPDVFQPVSGSPSRPQRIYIPRRLSH